MLPRILSAASLLLMSLVAVAYDDLSAFAVEPLQLPDNVEPLNDAQLAQLRGRFAPNAALRRLEVEMVTSWQEQQTHYQAGLKIALESSGKPRLSVSTSQPVKATEALDFQSSLADHRGLAQVNLVAANDGRALNSLTIARGQSAAGAPLDYQPIVPGHYASTLGSGELRYTLAEGRVGFVVDSGHNTAAQLLTEQGVLQQVQLNEHGANFANRMTLTMDWDPAALQAQGSRQVLLQNLKMLSH